MFWDNFIKLCSSKNTKPNPVGKNIGVSSGVLTKWKNGTIPNGETLIKLADYFDCSVDYLLGRISNVQGEDFSAKEKRLITAYRNKPEMQGAVDKLLGVDELTFVESGKIAAFGSGPKDATLSADALKDIDNLPDA